MKKNEKAATSESRDARPDRDRRVHERRKRRIGEHDGDVGHALETRHVEESRPRRHADALRLFEGGADRKVRTYSATTTNDTVPS